MRDEQRIKQALKMTTEAGKKDQAKDQTK